MERPLYRMLADQIETRITAGRYPIGTQLPSEPALEQEFGVSRITIRQALGLLKRRGFLASRSGMGTLVRSGGPDEKSMTISGSIRDLVYYAAGTRYTPVDRKLVVAPLQIGRALKVRRATKVLRFRGLRGRAQAGNFGVEEVYIPEPLGLNLDNAKLGTATFFNLLEQINGFRIVEAEQYITAAAAPADVARWLGIRARAPMLKAIRIYRLSDGRAVEVAVSCYDVSKFEYAMKLFRE